ncbi:mitogen-activated protein kinase kinase kinase 18-like [Magnolia sinica]|uniref:mitogen-activated protein kinase kinase kinase 18-like n=1 Tax=Magnolia sinica TaxID=86752 RepID=UPI0026591002|nr:mitogen-activated protein kinase kinase kinase 18-like [Magnolia sinica]
MGTCQWTRGRVIGRGSSATVSLASDHQTGKILAVKSVELAYAELLQREQRILSLFDCPHIVAYAGHDVTFENGKHFYNLLMEYADGGTLTDTIQRQGGRLEESLIGSYTREILQGLSYLHSKRLVHCDIKGRNVLIGSNGVKIADLGCAKWIDVSSTTKAPIAGTPLYMAPEVARREEQGFPADIWAVGCTVIEMATGRPPWPDVVDPITALYRIAHSIDVPESPRWLSEQAKDFLSKCLKRRPEERWTVDMLLKHPFIVGESNCPPKQVTVSQITNSPKSTLDHNIWDSFGEDQIHIDPSNNSPAERIQQLSGGSSSSRMPDWTGEGNWVSVRRSEEDENSLELEGQIPVEEMGGSDSVRDSDEGMRFRTSSLIEESDVHSSSMSDKYVEMIVIQSVRKDLLSPVNTSKNFCLLMKILSTKIMCSAKSIS